MSPGFSVKIKLRTFLWKDSSYVGKAPIIFVIVGEEIISPTYFPGYIEKIITTFSFEVLYIESDPFPLRDSKKIVCKMKQRK